MYDPAALTDVLVSLIFSFGGRSNKYIRFISQDFTNLVSSFDFTESFQNENSIFRKQH